ncbi:MAG: hypothetical protein NZ927_01135 [Candidatus Calescibacterium sp.]|nr:hypothetical protein [Candidatus Calescibacterium sp.]MCX7733686.1 hypothetical protein [bacterium]MDW8087977.1 hypothetical protein [Candidatus Calescibacterium sp.]
MNILVFILLFDVGLGIMLGEPTGINIKSWFRPNDQALHSGLSWSIIQESVFVFADWNKTLHKLNLKDVKLKFYPGVGLFVGITEKDTSLGLRVPLGVDSFLRIPINISFELSPSLSLIPDTKFKLSGFLAIRYVFEQIDIM